MPSSHREAYVTFEAYTGTGAMSAGGMRHHYDMSSLQLVTHYGARLSEISLRLYWCVTTSGAGT